MKNNKKPCLMYLLKVLEEFTDSNHKLTQLEIINKINNIYHETYDRRTISSSIDTLIDLGYDIVKYPRAGYALISRDFELSEIQFITDAIYSSRLINDIQTNELSSKLINTLSIYDRKAFKNLYKTYDSVKHENNDLFLNIELISEAIERGKMISFQYFHYDTDGNVSLNYKGMEYKASPYYIINNFGKYYLLAKYIKHNGKSFYRLDHMLNIKILDEDSILPNEAFGDSFNITKYINENIYMFGGEACVAYVKLTNKKASDYIIDWFGVNANIYHKDDGYYATIKCNQNAFFYWAMQYGQYIEVISPVELREKIKSNLEKLLEKYK